MCCCFWTKWLQKMRLRTHTDLVKSFTIMLLFWEDRPKKRRLRPHTDLIKTFTIMLLLLFREDIAKKKLEESQSLTTEKIRWNKINEVCNVYDATA